MVIAPIALPEVLSAAVMDLSRTGPPQEGDVETHTREAIPRDVETIIREAVQQDVETTMKEAVQQKEDTITRKVVLQGVVISISEVAHQDKETPALEVAGMFPALHDRCLVLRHDWRLRQVLQASPLRQTPSVYQTMVEFLYISIRMALSPRPSPQARVLTLPELMAIWPRRSLLNH